MDDTQKMLQAVIHGQNTLKQELVGRIDKLDKKLTGRVDGLEVKIDRVEKNLTERIDKIGMQLAYLEDDAPTREEFDNLAGRVDKMSEAPAAQCAVEQTTISVV